MKTNWRLTNAFYTKFENFQLEPSARNLEVSHDQNCFPSRSKQAYKNEEEISQIFQGFAIVKTHIQNYSKNTHHVWLALHVSSSRQRVWNDCKHLPGALYIVYIYDKKDKLYKESTYTHTTV